uniref:Uncharacterized protein n=1 Tax=Moniliophthora roreri TaxID=221103 RepID=A0A0W0FGT5_MONRR
MSSPVDARFKQKLASVAESRLEVDIKPSLLFQNSFSGSICIDRDSRKEYGSSEPSNAFHSHTPRPPTSRSSTSSHFIPRLDFAFQSFTVPVTAVDSRPSSPMHDHPPSLPPLPTLSQPLFPRTTTNKAPIYIPSSICHPNSPYVPWESPMRRQFLRPLTPDSYVSRFSGFSRSGAVAPEPWDYEVHNRPLDRISRGVRRIMTRVSRRLKKTSKQGRDSPRSSTEGSRNRDVNPTAEDPLPQPTRPFARVRSTSSLETTNTNSLSLWLRARQQQAVSRHVDERYFMTLEEYERVGSWIRSASGDGFDCGVAGCEFHSREPRVSEEDDDYSSTDEESSVLHTLDSPNTSCDNSHSHSPTNSKLSLPPHISLDFSF